MAWLLWPDTGTNTTGSLSGIGGNGEIDFPERNLNSAYVSGFVHHQDATLNSDQDAFKVPINGTAWQTAVIEWSPNLVVFKLNGVVIGSTTTRVPNTPMHWVLQTETALDGTIPADAARGNVQIDWVAAWAYAPPA